MEHTKQLNRLLMQQLSNVVTTYNAAAGFWGKHIAVLDSIRSCSIVDDDVLVTVEIAERSTRIVEDIDGAYVKEDMDCYNIAELRNDSDVIEAIRLVTEMTIKLAL